MRLQQDSNSEESTALLHSPAEPPPQQQQQQQYSLSSILWITTAVALLLAHARNLGLQSVQLLLACAVFWLVSAVLFSLISRKPKEVLFWSALIAVEAFLAVTAVRAFGFSQSCGWGLVGAVCGGFCAARPVRNPVLGSLISGVLGALSMALVFWYFGEPMDMERWLDLTGAIAVGLALWHFVEFMRWFRTSSGQSHLVVAAWLTLSVLAGNWAVAYFGF